MSDYPTAEAYEAACAALHRWRSSAEHLADMIHEANERRQDADRKRLEAVADRDEARATKDMHKERAEEAWGRRGQDHYRRATAAGDHCAFCGLPWPCTVARRGVR